VVPLLPPTGETGVGSLNPTLGASPFSITIVAEAKAVEEATRPTSRVSISAGIFE
jgi:hypothetical protein